MVIIGRIVSANCYDHHVTLPCVGSAKTDGNVGRLKRASDQLNHRLLAVVTGKVGTRHNFLEGSPNNGVGVA